MKVLLPTDFSDNAFNACRYALQMFAKDKVTFTLLHSYDINGYVGGSQFAAPPSESAIENAAHSTESALQQFRTKLQSYAASEL
ncbi:MAG TPA: universal stress protein, partial [Flavobacteriaceae bacterium]|nr:universal stress protein [Flavobacteriaceae bacterium]